MALTIAIASKEREGEEMTPIWRFEAQKTNKEKKLGGEDEKEERN